MNSINLMNKLTAVRRCKNFSKVRNAETLVRAQCAGEFVVMPKPVACVRSLGNLAALETFAVGMLALAQDVKNAAPILFGSSVIFRHVSISTHKAAIKQAANASAKLIDKGFSPKEIKFVANKIMKRNGNLVYSNLFRALYPKRMQKICQGIETRSGFFHIPFDRIGKALKLEKAAVQ